MLNLFDERYPLNMTMTRAPIADNVTKTMTISFDGTFFDVPNKTNHVDENTVYP